MFSWVNIATHLLRAACLPPKRGSHLRASCSGCAVYRWQCKPIFMFNDGGSRAGALLLPPLRHRHSLKNQLNWPYANTFLHRAHTRWRLRSHFDLLCGARSATLDGSRIPNASSVRRHTSARHR